LEALEVHLDVMVDVDAEVGFEHVDHFLGAAVVGSVDLGEALPGDLDPQVSRE
jgi:hypothetical protein